MLFKPTIPEINKTFDYYIIFFGFYSLMKYSGIIFIEIKTFSSKSRTQNIKDNS